MSLKALRIQLNEAHANRDYGTLKILADNLLQRLAHANEILNDECGLVLCEGCGEYYCKRDDRCAECKEEDASLAATESFLRTIH